MTHIKKSELTQLCEAYPIAMHHISEALGLTVPDFLAKVDAGEIGRVYSTNLSDKAIEVRVRVIANVDTDE
jgi:hypothetical protein